ncbi:1,5-anhydro-D-fructose reductase [Rubripirellula tenax]|uniref:1,5-anhydro-D-fructose reductase n=1 Tax=Rubripirellula tenax TaxID=2528015 RepID=A0A5C6F901_9BACT|nr:Gfo/Idh/MocA family oxidoreductase [Rubripirellula tenax]TWU56934.1 1,5-anhydro-D-fructose reductase [Rubripirellula tenax]
MRAGIVGVGFMGWIHYLAYQRSPAAEVVAFCSSNPAKRAGDWRSIQGNFGPPGEQIDVSGLNVYENFEDMLADDSIDVVDICLPPAMHAEAIRACLDFGKRCLCEKPLALDAATATDLAREATAANLAVAHILPLMPEFKILVDAAADGRFGKPVAGRFKRTIGPPDWIPDFYDADKVGGPLVDLHVHDAHLIRLLFGMPRAARTASHRRGGVPKFYETVFDFGDDSKVVSAGGGVIDSSARGFTHGYEVSFEAATIQYEFAGYADGSSALIPVTIMHNDGRVERPEFGDGDPVEAFVHEIDAVAKWIDNGEVSPFLDPTIAADALKICEMQLPDAE